MSDLRDKRVTAPIVWFAIVVTLMTIVSECDGTNYEAAADAAGEQQ